ncbi:DinB family protein [bacterium]|nr:DinB family protein [bacterium]
MANMPGMGNEPTMPAQLSTLVQRVLDYSSAGIAGLSVEQLADTWGGRTNSPGWDVWHVVRTIDNIIHFVFEREQPVWLQQHFDEQWGMPKVDQGTGQDPNDAYSMAFPEAAELDRYIKAVRGAVVPRIAAMDMDYLSSTLFIRPWGEIPRMEAIAHGLIGHGNGHLGRVSMARSLWGLPGLGY